MEDQLARTATPAPAVVSHPALVRRSEEKVASLCEALNDDFVRTEAATTFRDLIGSVTVRTDRAGRPVLDVEASTAALIELATTTPSPS